MTDNYETLKVYVPAIYENDGFKEGLRTVVKRLAEAKAYPVEVDGMAAVRWETKPLSETGCLEEGFEEFGFSGDDLITVFTVTAVFTND